jgi:hypothetical protein
MGITLTKSFLNALKFLIDEMSHKYFPGRIVESLLYNVSKENAMPKHLQLVESDFETIEKKKLPRFPFCYLTFKPHDYQEHVFEVRDISHSGMQLELKNESDSISR